MTSFSSLGRPHPKQKQNGTVGVVKDLDFKLDSKGENLKSIVGGGVRVVEH